jgi:hypothetical protein
MKIPRYALGRRLLLLASLICGLVFVAMNPQPAYARPCCSECDARLQACIDGCNGDSQCEIECERSVNGCYAVCDDSC